MKLLHILELAASRIHITLGKAAEGRSCKKLKVHQYCVNVCIDLTSTTSIRTGHILTYYAGTEQLPSQNNTLSSAYKSYSQIILFYRLRPA